MIQTNVSFNTSPLLNYNCKSLTSMNYNSMTTHQILMTTLETHTLIQSILRENEQNITVNNLKKC